MSENFPESEPKPDHTGEATSRQGVSTDASAKPPIKTRIQSIWNDPQRRPVWIGVITAPGAAMWEAAKRHRRETTGALTGAALTGAAISILGVPVIDLSQDRRVVQPTVTVTATPPIPSSTPAPPPTPPPAPSPSPTPSAAPPGGPPPTSAPPGDGEDLPTPTAPPTIEPPSPPQTLSNCVVDIHVSRVSVQLLCRTQADPSPDGPDVSATPSAART